jgi:hypothetical protein
MRFSLFILFLFTLQSCALIFPRRDGSKYMYGKDGSNTPVYPQCWGNKSDLITFENDTICMFEQGMQKIKENRKKYKDKTGRTHLPHQTYYLYDIGRKATYRISHDTLVITFIRVIPGQNQDKENQDRQNHYLVKDDKLIYLPDQSLSPFYHKKKTLARKESCD